MSWEDRDYARQPAPRHGIYVPGVSRWTQSVVNILLAVNIGIHLLAVLTPIGTRIHEFGAMHTPSVLHGQIWRIITSQYLHSLGGTIHIFFNMFTLYFLCRPLESLWGKRKFFAVYTAAGVVGNLCFLLAVQAGWLPDSSVAVGASGCILGLVGVCAVLFPTAQVIVFIFPMTMRTFALIVTVYYGLNIMRGGWNYGGDICHLGGLGFGVLWAMFRERGRVQMPPMVRPVARPRAGRRPSAPPPPPTAEIERILAKIHQQGIGSLSEAEKALLREATARQQEADRRYGRTDRL